MLQKFYNVSIMPITHEEYNMWAWPISQYPVVQTGNVSVMSV